MIHLPAEMVIKHLKANHIADEPDAEDKTWPAFFGRMPPEPEFDHCIVGTDTAPEPIADLLQGGRLQWEGVQLITRGEATAAGYRNAGRKAHEIKVYFEQFGHELPIEFEDENYTLHHVRLDSGPFFIGNEEQTERPMFSINYLIHLTIV